MAHANCSVCNGEINTESSPSGKCVRCLEAEAQKPAAPSEHVHVAKAAAAGERPPALQEHVGPKSTVLPPPAIATPVPEESVDHDRGHGKTTKHK